MRAYLIGCGEAIIPPQPVTLPDDIMDRLKAVQTLVGGHIEGYMVVLDDDLFMYANDDAKRLELPLNVQATALTNVLPDVILGNTVVVARNGSNDGPVALEPDEMMELVVRSMKHAQRNVY